MQCVQHAYNWIKAAPGILLSTDNNFLQNMPKRMTMDFVHKLHCIAGAGRCVQPFCAIFPEDSTFFSFSLIGRTHRFALLHLRRKIACILLTPCSEKGFLRKWD